MSTIPSSRCINCLFEPDTSRFSAFPSGDVEVFYGMTTDLNPKRHNLESYLTSDEKLRADKFHFSGDRDTYISSHSLLRSILSEKLGKNPSEVVFHYDNNNKPRLPGDPLYFNITHVRSAFAFVISDSFYAGIDMENTDRRIDILPIINSFFSDKERKFILESKFNAVENFFLLWTRKEALLKAIGTGIIDNLAQIEVSEKENIIYKNLFENRICEPVNNEHFIYSENVQEYFISIALPQKSQINMNQIKNENIESYLQ